MSIHWMADFGHAIIGRTLDRINHHRKTYRNHFLRLGLTAIDMFKTYSDHDDITVQQSDGKNIYCAEALFLLGRYPYISSAAKLATPQVAQLLTLHRNELPWQRMVARASIDLFAIAATNTTRFGVVDYTPVDASGKIEIHDPTGHKQVFDSEADTLGQTLTLSRAGVPRVAVLSYHN
jgi:hypothetical protein